MLSCFSLTQHIQFPTHISGHTLDLLITREGCGLVEQPSCGDLISDHYCILCNILLPGRQKLSKIITYRPLKTVSPESMKSALESALMSCDQSGDLDSHLHSFDSCIISALDTVAPIRTKKIYTHEHSSWFNSSLVQKKREVRKAERKWRASKSEEHKIVFTDLLNSLFEAFASARSAYYKDMIEKTPEKCSKLFRRFAAKMA